MRPFDLDHSSALVRPGMLQADHQFRRVNSHLHLPKLRAALEAHFTTNVSAASKNEDQIAA
jgi:hypothetical protein